MPTKRKTIRVKPHPDTRAIRDFLRDVNGLFADMEGEDGGFRMEDLEDVLESYRNQCNRSMKLAHEYQEAGRHLAQRIKDNQLLIKESAEQKAKIEHLTSECRRLGEDIRLEKHRYFKFDKTIRDLLPYPPAPIPQTTAKNETQCEVTTWALVDQTVNILQEVNQANAVLKEDVKKLAAFKAFVHKFLDDHGVPADPTPLTTEKTGCRIGRRLDWVLNVGSPSALKEEAETAVRKVWREIADIISCPEEVDISVYLKDKWNDVVKSRMEFNNLNSAITQKDSQLHNAQQTIAKLQKDVKFHQDDAIHSAKKTWAMVGNIIGCDKGREADALSDLVTKYADLTKRMSDQVFGSVHPNATARDHWAVAIFHGLMRNSKAGENYRDKMILAYQHYDASIAKPTSPESQTST